MQIGATTYTPNTSLFYSAYERTSSGAVQIEPEKINRYEPSKAVLGAAKTLPGQGDRSGFEVPGEFGFCQNCGITHNLLGESAVGEDMVMKGVKNAPASEVADTGESPNTSETQTNEKSETELPEEKAHNEKTDEKQLSEEDQQKVEELKKRDQEVRTHEHAHVAAGGQFVRGGIQFEYETGPDGKQYAVGGEVSIDTSPVSGDPQATIQKAQTIRRAALAPAQPSGQDRQAAAAASQMEMKARQELLTEKTEGSEEGVEDVTATSGEGEETATKTSKENGGLPVEKPDSKNKSVENSKKDRGLPEVSTSASSPPVVRLDYQQRPQTRHLVDVFA